VWLHFHISEGEKSGTDYLRFLDTFAMNAEWTGREGRGDPNDDYCMGEQVYMSTSDVDSVDFLCKSSSEGYGKTK
jgi:hypothetical protein